MEETKEKFNFFGRRKYKRLLQDEQRLFDKQCPKCRQFEMIGVWSWKLNKYQLSRCSRMNCDYETRR